MKRVSAQMTFVSLIALPFASTPSVDDVKILPSIARTMVVLHVVPSCILFETTSVMLCKPMMGPSKEPKMFLMPSISSFAKLPCGSASPEGLFGSNASRRRAVQERREHAEAREHRHLEGGA
eukprot:SRR837773.14817.p3 GENE.SRR837773.14817~~SRR837773.14817.p3  ORF type:complete len:122 (+),score=20.34 SRR837773.14817:454-819(+)